MTSGKLCLMTCPMLEDEMIHNLCSDKESRRIILLENDNTVTLLPKLKMYNVEYESMSEADFFREDNGIPDDGFTEIIWMMDVGLHEEPDVLRDAIHEALLKVDRYVDAILMYYGLCGNGLKGVDDWCEENLVHPMTIMRDSEGRMCDDCIGVPLDGTDNYLRLLRKYPGIMYLTPAFAGTWQEFMKHMELFHGVDQSDDDMAKMIFDMAGYTQTMKVQTGLGDQVHFQEKCEEYAKRYDLELIELEDGWVSTKVADTSYAAAKATLQ